VSVAAGATARIAAAADRTAAPRRSIEMGGCHYQRGVGQHGTPRRLGSVYLDGAVLRRTAGHVSRSRSVRGIPARRPLGRLTAAGQRRIRTGFPPYGCDDDAATLPAPRTGDRGRWAGGGRGHLGGVTGRAGLRRDRRGREGAGRRGGCPVARTATYVAGSLPGTAS